MKLLTWDNHETNEVESLLRVSGATINETVLRKIIVTKRTSGKINSRPRK